MGWSKLIPSAGGSGMIGLMMAIAHGCESDDASVHLWISRCCCYKDACDDSLAEDDADRHNDDVGGDGNTIACMRL